MVTSIVYSDQCHDACFWGEDTETEKLSHFLNISQSAGDKELELGLSGEIWTLIPQSLHP